MVVPHATHRIGESDAGDRRALPDAGRRPRNVRVEFRLDRGGFMKKPFLSLRDRLSNAESMTLAAGHAVPAFQNAVARR